MGGFFNGLFPGVFLLTRVCGKLSYDDTRDINKLATYCIIHELLYHIGRSASAQDDACASCILGC